MLYDSVEFGALRNRVLLVSAITWVCLFAATQFSPGLESHVHAAAHSPHTSSPSSLTTITASWTTNWFLMLAAMMAPTLIMPLWSIRVRNFARRRLRAFAVFVFGYAAVWMTVGALVLAADASLGILKLKSFWPAATLAILGFVWQASPAKQRCLNRCHGYDSFAAFGVSADVDAFRFGVTHGFWCVGSCWALMLLPVLLPWGHLPAMAAVSVLMFCERLENPTTPGWRVRGLGKAIRIVLTQTDQSLQRFVR